ncbi:MAG: non-ribosomal peptide synthetase, partial [Cytophagales bacterium]|nr:non-ribosomal peptide synthetase [Cytophagales bacterium]
VQDLDGKEAFLESLQRFARADARNEYTTKLDWSHELFLSRRFFEDLPHDHPQIEAVAASPKTGQIANELNLYRFDVVLEVRKAAAGKPATPRHKRQLGADVLTGYATLPLPAAGATASDAAYLIYTSGTENRPKGVSVTHRNLSNYLHWACQYYFREPDRGNMALLTSIAFDLTVTSLFCPLLRGKTLYVYGGKPVGALLLEALGNPEVDTLKLTPSHVSLLEILHPAVDHLKMLILGGEKLKEQHVRAVRALNGEVKVYNEYGPTETTVGCTAAEATGHYVEIGKPIANTTVYITDDNLQLRPAGNNGEICIAGEGVAAGYLNNPALNGKKFVPNPYAPGSVLYRTGDVGKWREDGSLVLAGRKDRQVKIRGNRIEPAEIEAALAGHPAVQDCVVVARENDQEPYLTAYVVSETPAPDLDLPGYLSGLLPASMVPAHFVVLKAFPFTPNGKTDTRALADPLAQPEAGPDYAAPRNDLENQLAAIWREVLRRDQIGIHENFFRLGGHSLKATQVISRIHQQLDVKVQLIRFFMHPTIAGLAAECEAVEWLKEPLGQDEAVDASRLEIIL